MSLPSGFLPIGQINSQSFGYRARVNIDKAVSSNYTNAQIGHNEIHHKIFVYNGPESCLVLSELIRSVNTLSGDHLPTVDQESTYAEGFTISLMPRDFSQQHLSEPWAGHGGTALPTWLCNV